jgi:roadblock/LC7 domain-containing protein
MPGSSARSRPAARAKAPRDLINVRFGPLCGLTADIPERREVPRSDICSAANCGYSITSSASASNLSGTSTPSIRAVGWLMTSSNFAACTIGRSAVFAP